MKSQKYVIYILVISTLAIFGMANNTAAQGSLADSRAPRTVITDCSDAGLSAALVPGANITFNCGVSPVTITLSNEKNLPNGISIDGGNKITLSGGGTHRIFFVDYGATATLANLTLTNGIAKGADSTIDGRGGAIANRGGTLTINNVTFSNNVASDSGPVYGQGGALFDGGGAIVNITGSTFIQNSADHQGGAIYNPGGIATIVSTAFYSNTVNGVSGSYGGAILNEYQLTIVGSTFSGNQARLSYIVPVGASLGGGGLYNRGTATIIDSNFQDNHTQGTGTSGGGIANYGTLYLNNGTLSNNSSFDRGGALFNSASVTTTINGTLFSNNFITPTISYGAAINNAGAMMITAGTLTSNLASGSNGAGAGIYNSAQLTIMKSAINSNDSTAEGGGIYNFTSGILTIIDSSFHTNIAGKYGGGVRNVGGTVNISGSTFDNNQTSATFSAGGIDSSGILNITNSTFSANSAPTANSGGALWLGNTTQVTNATFFGNSASSGGASIYVGSTGNLTLRNTLLVAASSPNCATVSGGSISSMSVNYTWGGVSGDASCSDAGIVNPGLDPILRNNGGSTQTHALLASSPVRSAGNVGACPPTDQRGALRPITGGGAHCSPGAYEYGGLFKNFAPLILR